MSLQKLLDEKYPLNVWSPTQSMKAKMLRDAFTGGYNEAKEQATFTKLEKASLMIAHGNMADGGEIGSDQIWAARMVALAKAVLEEANK